MALGIPQQAVDRADDHTDQVDVLPLVETADVVCPGHLPLVEYQVDGTGVVLDEEPVAHVLTLAVDGQRTAVADVVDEQWDELLGELVRAVVVRAVRDEHRHAVCVVVRAHEMVGRRLRGAVGAVGVVFRGLDEELGAVCLVVLRGRRRGEGRLHTPGMGQLEGPVHLVGRDVVEHLALISLRQRLPVFPGGLQQRQRPQHVGAREGERVLYRAVHVALGREVDDAVYPVSSDDLAHHVEVGDVATDERVVRPVLDVPEVGQVTGIRELVEVDDVVVGMAVDEQPHDMAADESGSAGDEYVTLHFLSGFLCIS